jgi:hypothetical protein
MRIIPSKARPPHSRSLIGPFRTKAALGICWTGSVVASFAGSVPSEEQAVGIISKEAHNNIAKKVFSFFMVVSPYILMM